MEYFRSGIAENTGQATEKDFNVTFENETAWLSIGQMADLFQRDRSVISKHIKNVFAERQAEREQAMTMQDWAKHLDNILTMSGEKLLNGNGSISHSQAMKKVEGEYIKYKAHTLTSNC